LAPDGSEWSASHPGHFTAREGVPSTHYIGGWVSPRASMDAVMRKNPSPCWQMNPDRPAHSPVTILTEVSRLLEYLVYGLPIKESGLESRWIITTYSTRTYGSYRYSLML